MGPRKPSLAESSGTARVREHLLTGLYIARLQPGERVPSVRRMAQLTGLDRKTVHRAYLRLAAEGLLIARPGSGTFLAPDPTAPPGAPDPATLLAAATRCLGEASALGMDPLSFARFLERIAERRLKHVTLAVVEANGEQLGLVARDVQTALGVTVRPVLLDDLAATARTWMGSVHGVVTTEPFRETVSDAVATLGLPIYSVAIDPGYVEALAAQARLGPIVLVVRDVRYEPALRRELDQRRVPAEVQGKLRVVDARGLDRAFREIDPPASVYVSPLLELEVGRRLPPGWRRMAALPYTEANSLELIRAQLALADVKRGGVGPGLAGLGLRAPGIAASRRDGSTALMDN